MSPEEVQGVAASIGFMSLMAALLGLLLAVGAPYARTNEGEWQTERVSFWCMSLAVLGFIIASVTEAVAS